MKRVIVFTVLILVLAGVGFAQSIEQKIIGTWVSGEDGASTWVFKTDGTLSINGGKLKGEYKYAVTDTYLAFHKQGDIAPTTLMISISSNGKTLICPVGLGNGIWLTKK